MPEEMPITITSTSDGPWSFVVPHGTKGKLALGGTGGNVIGLKQEVYGIPSGVQKISIPDCYTLNPGNYEVFPITVAEPFTVAWDTP